MKLPGSVLLLCLLAAMTAGCGFQLQGRADYAPQLEKVYLQVPDPNSDLARQLRRSVEAARVTLVPEPGQATAVIVVDSENYGTRVKSVSAQNRPTELEVFYTAEYRVRAGPEALVPGQRVTRTRIFTYDETQVLAKQQEELLLRESLAREIAGVITRRLAAVEP
ncbi:MAG: hypothetical protein P8080_05865 [Gammaproteobacteria bacterium]